MLKAAQRPCPLCGHREAHPLHSMRFALAAESPLPTAYEVVACVQCEFVYADTPGSSTDYERHYAEHSRYEDTAVATGGGDAPADRERIGMVADWIAKRVPAETSVLDIGCGNGGLLETLRARGFRNIAGVDPAAGCVARLRSRGMRAWQGTLERLPEEAAESGLVILSHVLEHVLDVGNALRKAQKRLRGDGYLYLETPDASRYVSRPFVPFYFFDSEHINHFDAASLAALGDLSGYAVVAAEDVELTVEGGLRYPVTRALLTAAPQFAGTRGGHTELRRALEAYIAESRRRENDSGLAAVAASGRPLALWGAGSYAQRLLAGPPLAGATFVAVIDRDRNKQGLLFAGCRIAPPEPVLRALPRDTVVIVAAALASEAIVAECRAMGIACHIPASADAG
jgi:SAM-dependent methyltransferase